MEYIYIYVCMYVCITSYLYPYTKPPDLPPIPSISLRFFRHRAEALLRYCRTSRLRRLRASFMARSSARVLEILETAEPRDDTTGRDGSNGGSMGKWVFSWFFGIHLVDVLHMENMAD